MKPTDTLKPKRSKWLRILKWTLLSLVTAAAIGAGTGYVWVYSWRWSETPAFHSSWSQKQQEQLRAIDEWMLSIYAKDSSVPLSRHGCHFLHKLILEMHGQEEALKEIVLKRLEDVTRRLYQAPIRDMLHECIRSGRTDIYTERGMSPALLALERCEDTELAKAMIERGGNPNKRYRFDISYADMERCMTPTQQCILLMHPDTLDIIPIEKRVALLEWMLAHGGDLNADEDTSTLLAMASAIRGDRGVMGEWMLRHGFTPGDFNRRKLGLVLLPITPLNRLKAMQQEGLIDLRLPELSDNGIPICTAMQQLGRFCCHPKGEIVQKAEWLLELGADVNALADTPEKLAEAEGVTATINSPLSLAISAVSNLALYRVSAGQAEKQAGLQMLEFLLQHGARLRDGEQPNIRPGNEQLCELLEKHSIPYTLVKKG
ncbi:MAG: hypothetical protein IJN29_11475 [Akkermansia sp.]|nr:hypothetical protein [Akkermansia sp.]